MLIAWFRDLLRRFAKVSARPASGPMALPPPEIEEADNNILDPKNIPDAGATALIPNWDGMAYRDHVYFSMKGHSDELVINQNAVGKAVRFYDIPKALFIEAQGSTLEINYRVVFADGGEDSQTGSLQITGGFDQAAELDLTGSNYLTIAGHPPQQIPEQAQMRRTADWGTAPYHYSSSDPDIASVDTTGEVTALANGNCIITATDRDQQAQSYALSISGMRVIHFLSASSNWQGMHDACTAAGLVPVPLADLKGLWQRYYPDIGPVAEYAGWLPYAFWSADELGAGTAWAYDLNGDEVNANASSHDTGVHLQALGLAN